MDFLKESLSKSWVLGNSEKSEFKSKEMKQGMDLLYWTDYLEVWNQAISKLKLTQPENLRDLITLYNNLSIANNPIVKLSKKIVENTNFLSLGNLSKAKSFNLNTNLVSDQYRALIILMTKKGSKTSNQNIDEVILKVSKIRNTLNNLSFSNDPEQKAYEMVQNINSAPLFEALSHLWKSAGFLPEPIQRWLQELVQNTTKVVFAMAEVELDRRWQAGPYLFFNEHLMGRYPFDLDSSNITNIKAFTDFFSSKGILDKFITQNLKPITEQNIKGQLVWKSFYGESFSHKQSLLKFISNSQKIQTTFLSGNNANILQLTLKPVYLSNKLLSLTLNYQGENYIYANGPEIAFKISWPVSESIGSNNMITLSYKSKSNGQGSLQYNGAWALFKFIQQNELSYDVKNEQYELKVFDQNHHLLVTYQVSGNSLGNPFDLSLFRKLKD